MIDETIVTKPKSFNANEKGESFHFDPQES